MMGERVFYRYILIDIKKEKKTILYEKRTTNECGVQEKYLTKSIRNIICIYGITHHCMGTIKYGNG